MEWSQKGSAAGGFSASPPDAVDGGRCPVYRHGPMIHGRTTSTNKIGSYLNASYPEL